jgi:hypothetical protein
MFPSRHIVMLRKGFTVSEKDRPPPEPEPSTGPGATMDETALGDLIRDYSGPLLGYVTKLTWGDRQLAEEAEPLPGPRTTQRGAA